MAGLFGAVILDIWLTMLVLTLAYHPSHMRLERGGRTGPSLKNGLGLALSRYPRLKDASSLTGQPTAKGTPTAEFIWDGLSAMLVVAGNLGKNTTPV